MSIFGLSSSTMLISSNSVSLESYRSIEIITSRHQRLGNYDAGPVKPSALTATSFHREQGCHIGLSPPSESCYYRIS